MSAVVPLIRMSPASLRQAPIRIFISVDLPAGLAIVRRSVDRSTRAVRTWRDILRPLVRRLLNGFCFHPQAWSTLMIAAGPARRLACLSALLLALSSLMIHA